MTAMPFNDTGVTTKPEAIAETLARIEARLSELERVADRAQRAFEQLPQLLAVVTDSLDQHLLSAEDAGVDAGERAAALLKIAERLTRPEALGVAETLLTHLPNLHRLLDSELLSSGAVQTVSKAGTALAAAADSHPQPAGPMRVLRALRDPAVQRSLGFALEFAQLFGRTLAPAEHVLPAQTAR